MLFLSHPNFAFRHGLQTQHVFKMVTEPTKKE